MSRIEERYIQRIKDTIRTNLAGACLLPNTDELFARIRERAVIGERKYGQTLERTDFTYLQWLEHLREEIMDALGYATKLHEDHRDDLNVGMGGLGSEIAGMEATADDFGDLLEGLAMFIVPIQLLIDAERKRRAG